MRRRVYLTFGGLCLSVCVALASLSESYAKDQDSAPFCGKVLSAFASPSVNELHLISGKSENEIRRDLAELHEKVGVRRILMPMTALAIPGYFLEIFLRAKYGWNGPLAMHYSNFTQTMAGAFLLAEADGLSAFGFRGEKFQRKLFDYPAILAAALAVNIGNEANDRYCHHSAFDWPDVTAGMIGAGLGIVTYEFVDRWARFKLKQRYEQGP